MKKSRVMWTVRPVKAPEGYNGTIIAPFPTRKGAMHTASVWNYNNSPTKWVVRKILWRYADNIKSA